MQRKFKDLFRKSDSHKTSFNEPVHSEHKSSAIFGGAQKGQTDSRFSSEDSIPERGRTKSVTLVHRKPPSRTNSLTGSVIKRPTDSSIHDNVDYQPYLPAKNQAGIISTGSGSVSLGGDPRLIHDARAQMKHSEEVANRNIERSAAEHEASLHKRSPETSHGSSLHSTTKESRTSFGMGARVNSGNSVTGTPLKETSPESSDDDDEDYRQYQSPPRKAHPARVARDESHLRRRPKRRGSDNGKSDDDDELHPSDFGPRITKEDVQTPKTTGMNRSPYSSPHSRPSAFDGSDDTLGVEQLSIQTDVDVPLNVVDTRNTEDVDLKREWSPAVTHETIKPIEHEIRQEHIYRDIHNHDVYHRIQPIIETEILPPKHYTQDPLTGKLAEVPDDQVPERWKNQATQRWQIGEKKITTAVQFPPPQAMLTSPKVVSEETYVTSEGIERKDSVILHPSTLEDLSEYEGAMMPIIFDHHGDKDGKDAPSVPGAFPDVDGSTEQMKDSGATTGNITPPRRRSSKRHEETPV